MEHIYGGLNMAIRKQVASSARVGTITSLQKHGDFLFKGKVSDDRTGSVMDFSYETRNNALQLSIGDKIEFQPQIGEPGKAIRVRKLGYNYG